MRVLASLLCFYSFHAQALETPPLFPVATGIYADLVGRYHPMVIVYSREKNEMRYYNFVSGGAKDSRPCLAAQTAWLELEDTKNHTHAYHHSFSGANFRTEVLNDTSFLMNHIAEGKGPHEDFLKHAQKLVKIGSEEQALASIKNFPICGTMNASFAPAADAEAKPPSSTNESVILNFGSGEIAASTPDDAVDFDFFPDGFLERTTWPKGPETYFLAIDRNLNGRIDDGGELFTASARDAYGKPRQNGFSVLSSFDCDGNGWIDNRDGIFEHLLLWNDGNHDGKSSKEELKTPCEMGVRAIGTQHYEIHSPDRFGNGPVLESSVHIDGDREIKSYYYHFINPSFRRGHSALIQSTVMPSRPK